MADPIVSVVVGNIIGRLSSEAVKKIGSLWGVNKELGELEKAILSIKALVVDAEKKLPAVHDNDKNQVRRWLKRLEDAVVDADDLLDEFSSYEAQRQMGIMADSKEVTKKVCTTFFSASNKLLLAGFRREKIKSMHDRLVSIRDDRNFHLEENNTINVTPFDDEGREKMAIIECLLDPKINEENNVSVFPIPRRGKKFVEGVVDDEKVANHFDLRMWFDVYYSNLNEREVIGGVLKSATNKDYDENIEMDQLHKELCEISKGKRYLLVLNGIDFSNSEIWQSLKSLLLGDCANGSKIIVTSSGTEAVADLVSAVEPYIYKRSLDPEESWNLFKNVVFKNNGQEEEEEAMMNNSKIVEIGKSIVERCRGNPFTIRTIGRMLLLDMEYENNNNNNPSEAEYWFSSFLENFSKIPQQHINTLLVLKLGWYDILPLPLKRCFLYYCRLFPKGFEIEAETSIINLWVAQGFIYSDSSSEQSVEDVGFKYFQYFKKRSFLEFGRRNYVVPNLVHELGILVSGATRSTQYASFELESSSKIPTLVAFQAKRLRALSVLPNDQLRSETEEGLSRSICDKIFSNCKLLRVLDLHNSGMEMVPDSMGKLKHLRYLDISGNPDIKALPNSITMLHCLIRLKLSSCYGLRELPRDIKKLISLKHLEIDWCYSLTHMPRGLGQLTQLVTLSEFVISNYKKGNIGNSCSLKELAKLNNLRGELKIKNLGNLEDDYSDKILKEKEHLEYLTLSWDFTTFVGVDNANVAAAEKQLECLEPHPNIKELALVGYEGIKFSDWLSSLRNLRRFSLRKCNCQHLSPLSQLPSLRVLILDQMTNLEYIISKDVVHDTSSAGEDLLSSLVEIRLTELPNLEGWRQQEEHPTTTSSSPSPSFDSLFRLVIEDCPKLRSMPLYLSLAHYLVLDNTSFDTFQHTINAPLSDSGFAPLEWLRTLCIIGIKKLDITQCDNIKWERLRSLRFLRLDYLPKLDKLPDGLHHLTTLQQLHIWRCNIKTLPEWIGNFKNLEKLGISVCPFLNSLPQALESLPSLETLEIEDCPILFQSCQRETGKDWAKIRHIRNLKIHQPQSSLSPRF